MRRWVLPGTLLCGFLLVGPRHTGAAEVREIRVENIGSGAIDEQSVLAFTSLRTGQELDRNAIARDIKALQKSGRFAFVGAKATRVFGGVAVIYEVKNKARFRQLRVNGARLMDSAKVRKLMDLQQGDPVDDTVMAVKVQEVRDRYRKSYFPYTKITWRIDEDPDTGFADIELDIDEGERAKIKRITFEGNHSVSARRLRKAMKQRRANLFSVFTKAGLYDPGELEMDQEALRNIYLDEGFADVRIQEPQVRGLGRSGIGLHIVIDEGQQYRIGQAGLEGVTLFPEEEVRGAMTIHSGDVASWTAIEQSAQAVRDYFGSRGYVRTRVRRRLEPVPDRALVNVTFEVVEGTLAYIRSIPIRGNTRTKDKVIRREMAIYPGDIYNEVKVRRSENRVRNLGYFSTVHTVSEPTADPDKYDIAFEVEEKKTGQFVVGAGFSSIDNLLGFIEISQGNFDIGGWPHFTGGGQKLNLRVQLGTKRRDAEISFTEPWFLDRRLSLGVSLFQSDRRFLSDDYAQRNTGGSVVLGKALGGFNRVSLRYSLENIDVFDVAEDASEQIKEEEGARIKSAMTLGLTHDTRDSVFVATRGNRSSVSAELAGGPLGGETDLYLLESRTSQYWPLWFDHVFNVRGAARVVEEYGSSDRVPIFDRLFLGGARTLRGFDFRDVGPKDENGEPVGGKTSANLTCEYTVPLWERVRFAAFYDVGNAWEEAYDFDFGNLNSDYGFGVRIDLPQFPLQLDYAWPLEADEFNDSSSGRFNFLLGYVY